MKKILLPKDYAFLYDASFTLIPKTSLFQKSHQVTDLF